MSDTAATPQQRFAALVTAFLGHPDVTPPGTARKSFGAEALKVRGKIFAMLMPDGRFVLKLPRARVDAICAAGAGQRLGMNYGRVMKEWVAVDSTDQAQWQALATEAFDFVAAGAKAKNHGRTTNDE